MYCSLVRNGSTAWVTGSSSMFWHIYILTRLSCIIFSNTPIFHHPYVLSFDTHGYVPIPICCFTCRHHVLVHPIFTPVFQFTLQYVTATLMFQHPYVPTPLSSRCSQCSDTQYSMFQQPYIRTPPSHRFRHPTVYSCTLDTVFPNFLGLGTYCMFWHPYVPPRSTLHYDSPM